MTKNRQKVCIQTEKKKYEKSETVSLKENQETHHYDNDDEANN